MDYFPFHSDRRLSPAQWVRIGKLVRNYRESNEISQTEFAVRLTAAVSRACERMGSPEVGLKYDNVAVSRMERLRNWTPAQLRRATTARFPSLRRTYQLEGLAEVLGTRVNDLIGEPGSGYMRKYLLDASARSTQVLNHTLQQHEQNATEAIVWSKTLISLFFPEPALWVYYATNFTNPALAAQWVESTKERRDAVLGRASTRGWNFTHVLFNSDLHQVVRGEGSFRGMDWELRAGCLESVCQAVTTARACHVAIVDDLAADSDPVVAELQRDLGVYTHLSNMGSSCVLLNDLTGTWHIGESRADVRCFHGILDDLVGRARYRETSDLVPYLQRLIHLCRPEP